MDETLLHAESENTKDHPEKKLTHNLCQKGMDTNASTGIYSTPISTCKPSNDFYDVTILDKIKISQIIQAILSSTT